MPDDKTQTLGNGGSFEERLLARLDSIDSRLTALEQSSEERSRDTRPLFEAAIKEMQQTRAELTERFDRFEDEIRGDLRAFGNRLDIIAIEINKTQGHVRDLDRRLAELERRPA